MGVEETVRGEIVHRHGIWLADEDGSGRYMMSSGGTDAVRREIAEIGFEEIFADLLTSADKGAYDMMGIPVRFSPSERSNSRGQYADDVSLDQPRFLEFINTLEKNRQSRNKTNLGAMKRLVKRIPPTGYTTGPTIFKDNSSLVIPILDEDVDIGDVPKDFADAITPIISRHSPTIRINCHTYGGNFVLTPADFAGKGRELAIDFLRTYGVSLNS
jgi:hypothetical protein